jgi:hypothetical protein
MRKYLYLFIILVSVFTSCNKNEEPLPITSEAALSMFDYKVRDGFLVFSNKESFVKTTKFIGSLSDIEKQQWESKIGFQSQHSMFMKLINEELVKDSLNRIKYAEKDLSKVDKRDYHSEYYYEMLAKGVIKLLDEGTPNEYWDYSVYDRSSTPFINENGLFAIGDTLYQITNHKIKSMLLTKDAKKQDLLSTLSANNTGIQKMSAYVYDLLDCPGQIWASWTTKGSWPSVQRRIRIGTELSFVEFLISLQRMEFKHNFYVQCQKTSFVNKWIYELRSITVNGAWKIYAYSNPQYYESTITYTTSASDLKGCVNPGDGSTAPFGTDFLIYPNSSNQNPYPPGDDNSSYGLYWQYNSFRCRPQYYYYKWEVVDDNQSMTSTISYNY